MLDLKVTGDGVLVPVIAQPGAKRTGIVKLHGGAVKVAVKGPPDKGRANEAILEFLAEMLHLPQRSIELVAGATSRKKMVLIRRSAPDAIRDAIERSIRGEK